MSILNVEHLSHGFGDRAIFHDVSFRLLKGEHIGLIGANGEGKSTFMNIITGRLQPDEGKVEWSKNVRAGYLDQHTALEKGMTIRQVLTSAFDFLLDMEQELNGIYEKMGEADEDTMQQLMEDAGTLQELLTAHDFYMIDSKVEEVGRALGLSEIGLDKDVSELSGGQRTKVLLGKLLLEKPDILLLDEPTNYLDVSHIEWLKRYLNDYENAFILISHDIPFLNSVVNLIYHMDNQQLTRYVGDYDKFQEVYAMKKAQLEAAYNKQQKEIADLKDFVARNKARVSTRNMAMSRQKKLDKMDVIELQAEKPKPEFHFKEARTPGRYIFQTSDLVIGYDEPLSSPLNLSMERGSKIVITGDVTQIDLPDGKQSGLREALRVLQTMGYVTIVHGKGAFIKACQPSSEEAERWFEGNIFALRDIYMVREALEPLVAREAARHITEEALAELRQIVDQTAHAAALPPEDANANLMAQLDEKFHEKICESTNNPFLVSLYKQFIPALMTAYQEL